MPFGISSASEYFQKHMNEILYGLPGVVCLIDDILVHGTSQTQYDEHLKTVLKYVAGMSLIIQTDIGYYYVSWLCNPSRTKSPGP